MSTLIFVYPTTGHQVSTGVEVDRSSFKSLPRTKTSIFCPRCGKNCCRVSGLGYTAMSPKVRQTIQRTDLLHSRLPVT
jgi:hypothetical protein